VVSPESCAQSAAEWQPAYELARQWCGVPALERHDELVALRVEVRRLGALIERAVTALGAAGETKSATAIERDLGVPIEVLRSRSRQ
jgi:hypothetical protein